MFCELFVKSECQKLSQGGQIVNPGFSCRLAVRSSVWRSL
ncbi:hypothetical protein NSP_10140 [Nodularia spumigena CCY9414]|nr:hypothetical protein NSP_10140 [Nodularia spumigena CCY9414]